MSVPLEVYVFGFGIVTICVIIALTARLYQWICFKRDPEKYCQVIGIDYDEWCQSRNKKKKIKHSSPTLTGKHKNYKGNPKILQEVLDEMNNKNR